MAERLGVEPSQRRDAIDVARVLALTMVVAGHLALAVIDRPNGAVRGANILLFQPKWAGLTAAAPMPVFFAAGGYANATATLATAARRLRVLAGLGAVVVVAWSLAVVVAVAATSSTGIVGSGARLATQPLWFVAAYAPFAAAGRPLARFAGRHPVLSIGGCLAVLTALDLARFAFGAPDGIGWIGFAPAWGAPWLAGGWWRHRVEHGGLNERCTGTALTAVCVGAALVLVHVLHYSPALIDVVPGARSNTTPPTLYTAVAGLAQVGVLVVVASFLDSLRRRRPKLWDRAGEAAVGVYAWHLTALTLCVAGVAIGFPVPLRFTAAWWLTRPLWWLAVLVVTAGFVVGTARFRHLLGRRPPRSHAQAKSPLLLGLGVIVITAAGAVVGLKGPRSPVLAVVSSTLFVVSWLLLRDGSRVSARSSDPRREGGTPGNAGRPSGQAQQQGMLPQRGQPSA